MPGRLKVLVAICTMDGGGAEHQVIAILNHLDRRRFTPLLYLLNDCGELISEVPGDVPVFSLSKRMPHARRPFPGWSQCAGRWDLACVLAEQQVDVIYDRTYRMTLIAAGATRFCAVPRVAACVADPEVELRQHARISIGLSRWNARRAYRRASIVAANSHGLRQRVIDYFQLPPEHVTVLPNLVDVNRIDRLAESGAPPFEPGRFHIVSVGRLHPQKGYQHLLSAIDLLVNRLGQREICWHLLGTGPEEPVLRSEVAARGLTGHVRFEGFLHNAFSSIRAANLLCLPSLNEGFPNVLAEAAVCRTPILAADCPSGPREILDGGRLGRLVPPANTQALADAILDCIVHPATWQARTEAARQHVETHYALAAGMSQLQELLERAAGAKSERQRRHRTLYPGRNINTTTAM